MNTDEITIRAFDVKDLTESDALIEAQAILSPVGELTQEKRVGLARIFVQHPYYAFVAEENGKIVGSVILLVEQKIIHNGGLCGHLETLTVLPNQQGKGIGVKLISSAIEQARQLGCYKVILDCKDDLIGFYEKNGFVKQGSFMRIDM